MLISGGEPEGRAASRFCRSLFLPPISGASWPRRRGFVDIRGVNAAIPIVLRFPLVTWAEPGRQEAGGRINATGNVLFSYGRSAGPFSVQPTAAALSPVRLGQGPCRCSSPQ